MGKSLEELAGEEKTQNEVSLRDLEIEGPIDEEANVPNSTTSGRSIVDAEIRTPRWTTRLQSWFPNKLRRQNDQAGQRETAAVDHAMPLTAPGKSGLSIHTDQGSSETNNADTHKDTELKVAEAELERTSERSFDRRIRSDEIERAPP